MVSLAIAFMSVRSTLMVRAVGFLLTVTLSTGGAFLLAVALSLGPAFAGFPGAIYTTTQDGTTVNQNTYGASTDVYLSGGPQNMKAAGLPDGTYYFQITDPSGATLLSTDPAMCRQLEVINHRVSGSSPKSGACKHKNGTKDMANGTTPVQMAPFKSTPNAGLEYKAWLIAQTMSTSISPADNTVINFDRSDSKTDDFKVLAAAAPPPPPPGSCEPSSSLSVLVSGANVISYVPKGNWSFTHVTDVSVVNVEGSAITPTRIPTPNVVNSCASNPVTGTTVCTANNTDVYLLSGTTLTTTLTSGGSGLITFSGGSCTNCG